VISPIIWIATTAGPVEIVSITREDPGIRSVLCVQDSFEELPISSLYDSFVKRPTGIIEKITGHPSYRTDLSAPITQGSSWQLGITIAHLFHSKELTKKSKHEELAIFCTGSVTASGEVVAVNRIQEKWNSFNNLLAENDAEYCQILIVSHPDNLNEMKALANTASGKINFTYLGVSDVEQIISYFGFRTRQPKNLSFGLKLKINSNIFLLSVLLLTLIICGNYMYELSKPLHYLDNEGRHKELNLELSFLRKEGSFLETNGAFFFEKYLSFRSAKLSGSLEVKLELVKDSDSEQCSESKYATISTMTLPEWSSFDCAFRIHLSNKSNSNLGVWVAISKKLHNEKTVNFVRSHAELGEGLEIGLAKFRLPINKRKFYPTIVVLVSSKPDDDVLTWYDKIINEDSFSKKMVSRIRKSGFGIVLAKNSQVDS